MTRRLSCEERSKQHVTHDIPGWEPVMRFLKCHGFRVVYLESDMGWRVTGVKLLEKNVGHAGCF